MRHPFKLLLLASTLLGGVVLVSETADARPPAPGASQFRAMRNATPRRPSINRLPRVSGSASIRLLPRTPMASPSKGAGIAKLPNLRPATAFPKQAFVSPPNGGKAWTSPNGKRLPAHPVAPGGGSVYPKGSIRPIPPNVVAPLIVPAGLGLRPAERRMTDLRDHLTPAPIPAGPGAAPLPTPAAGNGQPGAGAPRKPDNGCVGAAGNLPSPGATAATGERVPARRVRELERRTSGDAVLNLRDDSFVRGDRPGIWWGRTNEGHPAAVSHGRDGSVTVVTNLGDGMTSTAEYRRTSSGRLAWVRTTDRTLEGKVTVRTPATESAWFDVPEEEDGRGNTIEPTPTGGPDSQPAEGAPDRRDYWCEAGVTNPDGPNGSRRQPSSRSPADLMQPGRSGGSGVIIVPNTPPTPAELRERVTQPGVDGSNSGRAGAAPRPPAVSRFAQPPRGGAGQGATGGSAALLPPALQPKTPRPVDPE